MKGQNGPTASGLPVEGPLYSSASVFQSPGHVMFLLNSLTAEHVLF